MANIIVPKPQTIMVIPDSHSTPDHHNKRYSWLSNLAIDIKPNTIVDIGDWFDLSSLCSYDKGTKGFHGRRYQADIAAGIEAQDRLIKPLKKRKKKMPRLVRTLGNHENRINRAIDVQAELLEGTIGLKDLQSKEYGFEEYPFLQPVNINGVNFAHYFTSGVMGRPVSSARACLNQQSASCVQGHSHLFDYATKCNVEGRRMHAIQCGVYQDYIPQFAAAQGYLWRAGVLILRDVWDGDFDMEWISIQRMEREYG